jgi:predicted nucleotide-binding protein (sugar kinase/HSP70/actin superfamily)
MLFKMMLRTRPYEKNKGDSEAVFEQYLQRLIRMMPEHRKRLESNKLAVLMNTKHLAEFEELLRRAQDDFARIPLRDEDRPLVGVVGEYYVRLDPLANQDILRKLEAEGAETWLAPATEFFGYVNYLGRMLSRDRLKDCGWSGDELREFVTRAVNVRLATKDEHALYHASTPFLEDYYDIGPGEVIAEGSKYVNYNFGGEAICSMGKSEDFAKRGLAGVVSVIPFNCMPGNTVTALSQALRRRHNNIPFLNLDYDGFMDSSRDAKIVNFMWQVKERHAGRRAMEAEQEAEGDRADARSAV